VAVTAGNDGVLRVWDLLAGRLRGKAQTEQIWALACTRLADGTAVAVTSSPGGVIRFWDVATADPYGQPVTCGSSLPPVASTRLVDDTPVVVIGDGAALLVWDLRTAQFRGTPLATDFDVNRLACLRLADGTCLAVTGSDRQRDDEQPRRYGTVQAWDLATGRRYGPPLTGHGGEIEALAVTQLADGMPVAVSVDRYATVRVWNLATGQAHGPSLPRIGPGETREVACTRLPNGTPVLVTATQDVQVWSLVVEPSPQALTGPIWTMGCTELPDGDEAVVTVGYEDRWGYTVQLWHASTGRPRGRLLVGQAEQVVAAVRGRDGAAVVLTPGAATPQGRAVRLWDVTSGEGRDVVLAGYMGGWDILDCVRLRDGTPILIASGPVRAWDVDTGHPYGPALPEDLHWRRALSCLQLPDGTPLVILLDNHGNLRARDLRTGLPYGSRLAGPGYEQKVDVMAGALLPDGTPMVVTVAEYGYGKPVTMRVWDLTTGHPHGQPIHLRTSYPYALTCTRQPDGTAIAAVGGAGTPSTDGVVEIWDLADRRNRHEITLPSPCLNLHFTGEHQLVVRTYLDIAVYDLP
jgi:WD40 repeat protein